MEEVSKSTQHKVVCPYCEKRFPIIMINVSKEESNEIQKEIAKKKFQDFLKIPEIAQTILTLEELSRIKVHYKEKLMTWEEFEKALKSNATN